MSNTAAPVTSDPNAQSILAIVERSAIALGKMGLGAEALATLSAGVATGEAQRKHLAPVRG